MKQCKDLRQVTAEGKVGVTAQWIRFTALSRAWGAHFLKASETFWAREIIFSSTVSKNGETYAPEKSCMRRTCAHIKTVSIKQLCHRKVRYFTMAFWARKVSGAYKKRAPVDCILFPYQPHDHVPEKKQLLPRNLFLSCLPCFPFQFQAFHRRVAKSGLFEVDFFSLVLVGIIWLDVYGLFSTSGKVVFLYSSQINARTLIGQSAMGYCAGKPMENRVSSELFYESNGPHFLWIYRGNNPTGMFGGTWEKFILKDNSGP